MVEKPAWLRTVRFCRRRCRWFKEEKDAPGRKETGNPHQLRGPNRYPGRADQGRRWIRYGLRGCGAEQSSNRVKPGRRIASAAVISEVVSGRNDCRKARRRGVWWQVERERLRSGSGSYGWKAGVSAAFESATGLPTEQEAASEEARVLGSSNDGATESEPMLCGRDEVDRGQHRIQPESAPVEQSVLEQEEARRRGASTAVASRTVSGMNDRHQAEENMGLHGAGEVLTGCNSCGQIRGERAKPEEFAQISCGGHGLPAPPVDGRGEGRSEP